MSKPLREPMSKLLAQYLARYTRWRGGSLDGLLDPSLVDGLLVEACWTASPRWSSHRRTALPFDADASNLPSGENAMYHPYKVGMTFKGGGKDACRRIPQDRRFRHPMRMLVR
jgi:hypothetical protein